jgi:serine/threonine-protein kinase
VDPVSSFPPPSEPAPYDPADELPTIAEAPPQAWNEADLDVPASTRASVDTHHGNRRIEEWPTIGHIGRYALKYQLGQGGLGTVYAAHDPLLSRAIAIKTLHVALPGEQRESINALLLNEARAAAGLSHRHIVTVYDAGLAEQGVYIAMELLKGRDLRQLRQDGWGTTAAQAALIVRRVADALAYAHSKGVVHRDIKPANIFMVSRTQPRVLDFGIARIADRHDLVPEDSIAGSPQYMAPEQLRREAVDQRADVFSLGAVLYELLTGQRPFQGPTLKDITQAVLDHEPSPAHEVNPAVPVPLSDICSRAMAKDPATRTRSARQMSRELRHWLDDHPEAVAQARSGKPDNDSSLKRRLLRWSLGALALTGVGATLWSLTESAHHGAHAAQAVVATPAPAVAIGTAAAPGTAASAAAATAAAVASVPTQPPASIPPAISTPPAKPTASPRAARHERAIAATPAPAVAPATGLVKLAVSPWGRVEVDGVPAGLTPPLNQITLAEGRHEITVRNEDFPPYTTTVTVSADQPASIRYRFGP